MTPDVTRQLVSAVAEQRRKRRARGLVSDSQPTGGPEMGRERNSGDDRWFIPNYDRRRFTPRMNNNYVNKQLTTHLFADDANNVAAWRNNIPGTGLSGQAKDILHLRPQDQVAQIPSFLDTGVDERYLAFKNYMKFGTTRPGFDPYQGAGGYG